MRVEQEFSRSDASLKSEVLVTAWFYGPTYLEDDQGDDPSGEHYLFVRRYRLLCQPSGQMVVRYLRDVETYESKDAMTAAIQERDMGELPSEDPPLDWIPSALLDRGWRAVAEPEEGNDG